MINNVKAWLGEIDKHVSYSINKLLVENNCDLTSQEELTKDEAKELAASLRRAIRVRQVKVPGTIDESLMLLWISRTI